MPSERASLPLRLAAGAVVFLPDGFLVASAVGSAVPSSATSSIGSSATLPAADAFTGTSDGCTLRRTPRIRAAPVRVPRAAAVLRRIGKTPNP